jgi:hypothetical protein
VKTVTLHGARAAGLVALVDDDDYELISQHRWHVNLALHVLARGLERLAADIRKALR